VVVSVIFSMTLPGIVLLLLVLTMVTRHRRPEVSAAGLEVFTASVLPGKQIELDQRHVSEQLRDDSGEGAPPLISVDLERRVARIRR
jgi:hypothetical protein